MEHVQKWRFGSDHFPFFSWVMAVGEPAVHRTQGGLVPVGLEVPTEWWLRGFDWMQKKVKTAWGFSTGC